MSKIPIHSQSSRHRAGAIAFTAAVLSLGLAAVVTAAPVVAQEKMTTPTPAGEEAEHPLHHG